VCAVTEDIKLAASVESVRRNPEYNPQRSSMLTCISNVSGYEHLEKSVLVLKFRCPAYDPSKVCRDL
jgi:hypothetical protein